MSRSAAAKTNDTPSRSFRMDDDLIAKLDDLVKFFAEENGRSENRTTVLYQLINREHARRQKGKKWHPGREKKEEN